jgi:ribosomal protein L4
VSLAAARGEPQAKGDPEPSTLIVDGELEWHAARGEALRRAAANLARVHVLPSVGLNVYSILQQRTLVLTEAAVAELSVRLTAPIKR